MNIIRRLMYSITKSARFITVETATAEECQVAIDYYTPLGWLDYDPSTPHNEAMLKLFKERLEQLENKND